jgi:hypothetical protein
MAIADLVAEGGQSSQVVSNEAGSLLIDRDLVSDRS